MINLKNWALSKSAKSKIHPEIWKSKTVGEILETASILYKDKKYLIFAPTDESFTYNEFYTFTRNIAGFLKKNKIKKKISKSIEL